MHRPVMWRPFLLEALERYRTRTGKRCVPGAFAVPSPHLSHPTPPVRWAGIY
jgi:hypothetical protein